MMMYPFMTLNDETEIVHSDMDASGQVKVYIEKPDEHDCFHHATCYLPGFKWAEVFGFSDAEMAQYKEIVRSASNLILEFAADGGFENASGFLGLAHTGSIFGLTRVIHSSRFTSMFLRVLHLQAQQKSG